MIEVKYICILEAIQIIDITKVKLNSWTTIIFGANHLTHFCRISCKWKNLPPKRVRFFPFTEEYGNTAQMCDVVGIFFSFSAGNEGVSAWKIKFIFFQIFVPKFCQFIYTWFFSDNPLGRHYMGGAFYLGNLQSCPRGNFLVGGGETMPGGGQNLLTEAFRFACTFVLKFAHRFAYDKFW